ncbi:ERCC4 domain-containing protein [Vibrio crassostreae]|uniref:ERCC4 domain-containing protein n=1 Tax=Vibrio crassostreae TaxID=246167 RepID=UPI001B317EF4|nr:ERCC4 domain-containing protein [Vibrio crassostreae]
MKFVLWGKGGAFRIYIKGTGADDDPVVTLEGSRIKVNHDNDLIKHKVIQQMVAGGLSPDSTYTRENLISAFNLSALDSSLAGDLATHTSSTYTNQDWQSRSQQNNTYHKIDTRDASLMFQESEQLDVGSAPFRSVKTCRDVSITVDTREPKSIFNLVRSGKIENVSNLALEIGDILLQHDKTGDTLIIERKTVTDLYNSTVSAHLHSQAERLFEYAQVLKNNGSRVRVVWVVEGEQQGARMLYNAFREVKQTDGLVNYLVGILDQHVISTFSQTHTAYMVMKLAQGFFEQELKYPVSTALKKKERASDVTQKAAEANHNVNLPSRGGADLLCSINGINRKSASSIIDKGYSIKDLCLMSIEQLCGIDNVGAKSAEKIYNALNGT